MSDIRIVQSGEPGVVEASDGGLTLSVPIQIKRRSGRKLMTLPNGEAEPARPWDTAPPRCSWRWRGASLARHVDIRGG
jgi:hypothetical protein